MGLARHAREDLGRRPRSVGPQDDLDRVLHRAVAEGDDDAAGRVEALNPRGRAFQDVELRLAVGGLCETVAGTVRGGGEDEGGDERLEPGAVVGRVLGVVPREELTGSAELGHDLLEIELGGEEDEREEKMREYNRNEEKGRQGKR